MLLHLTLAVTILVQFSGSESINERGCKAPGVFPHPNEDKQFLICANDHGKVFVAETVLCPEGYVFSVAEKTCVQGQQTQPESPTTKIRRTRAAEAGACKSSGPYCEGCDRLVVCVNMGENVLRTITNISCSEIAPEMTCSKASCTTQAPATQNCEGSGQAGAFRCLQPGFFPDPSNCTLFHFCSNDLSHFLGECDEQYNADRRMCMNVDSNNISSGLQLPECTNITNWCKGNNTTPAKFPSYPSFYVICLPIATKNRKSTIVYQVAVAKCPGRQEYNDTTQLCEMTCTAKRGRFPDPENCRSYFECTGKNPAVKKSCPENNAFDKDRNLCLPEFMVQGCRRTRAVETSTTITTQ